MQNELQTMRKEAVASSRYQQGIYLETQRSAKILKSSRISEPPSQGIAMKRIPGERRANIRTDSDGEILCTLETKDITTTINIPSICYTLTTAVVSYKH
jgi:hypothetical protein